MAAERGPDGKFLPGNKAAVGNGGGRPSSDDAERVTASLSSAISNGTLGKWAASFKRRLERADPWATEFLWNRMIGKETIKAEISGPNGAAQTHRVIIEYVGLDYNDDAETTSPA